VLGGLLEQVIQLSGSSRVFHLSVHRVVATPFLQQRQNLPSQKLADPSGHTAASTGPASPPFRFGNGSLVPGRTGTTVTANIRRCVSSVCGRQRRIQPPDSFTSANQAFFGERGGDLFLCAPGNVGGLVETRGLRLELPSSLKPAGPGQSAQTDSGAFVPPRLPAQPAAPANFNIFGNCPARIWRNDGAPSLWPISSDLQTHQISLARFQETPAPLARSAARIHRRGGLCRGLPVDLPTPRLVAAQHGDSFSWWSAFGKSNKKRAVDWRATRSRSCGARACE